MPAAKQLRISLFGEPLVRFDDAPIRWSAPRRALSLLVYLVLQGRPVSRDTLAFRLWPDAPEPDARANLRRHLMLVQGALPKAAGGPWLIADHRTVQWREDDGVWCDVRAFEALSADVQTLPQAVDLYGGELASGLDDEWLIPERERLRELQFRNLRTLVEHARRSGSAPEALTFAGRILAMDPWREDAVRAVIALRSEMGDRAGALQFYREFEARLQQELGVAPMPETIAAYDDVRTGAHPGMTVNGEIAGPVLHLDAGTKGRSNVPHPLSTFIGRRAELARLSDAVREARLTTIWGSGGVGKTRLACEASQTLLHEFADGVRLVELGSAVSDSDVFSTAASVLGAQCARDETPADGLVAALRAKSMLLILDNCEHVIGAAVQLIGRVISGCPHVTIVATSREPLGIPGETILPLGPLDVPPPADDLESPDDDIRASSAALLLLERTRTNGVEIDPARDGAALRTICRRLDGIPLALEIAARRARVMPLAQIAAMLDGELQILSGDVLRAHAAQPSLEAAIGWSFALLHERGRRILRRLTVFRGAFDLDDAIAVCSGVNEADLDVFDDILGLVDKSMVVLTRGPTGSRYRLLETIRSFVRARADAQEVDAAHRALVLHYLQCITPYPGVAHRGDRKGRQSWFARVAAQVDNIRGALEWAFHHEDGVFGVELLEHVAFYFSTSGLLTEVSHWYEAALATPAGKRAFKESQPTFIDGIASVMATRGYPLDALPLYERSLASLYRMEDYRSLISTLQRYGFAQNLAGKDAEAERIFCQAQTIAEAHGDEYLRGVMLYRRASAAHHLEEYTRALSLLEDALAIARRYEDDNLATRCVWERSRNPCWDAPFEERVAMLSAVASTWRKDGEYVLLAIALQDLGRLLLTQNETQRAIPLIGEGLRVGIDARRDNSGIGLENSAHVAAGIGDWQGAAFLLGAARASLIRPASAREAPFRNAIMTRVESMLGRAETAAAAFAGGTCSVRDAVARALHILQEAGAQSRQIFAVDEPSGHERANSSR